MNMFSRLFGLWVVLALCSCVYDVPLAEEALLPIDPALVGIWQLIPEEGEAIDPEERLIILPFSTNEYVVVKSPGEGAVYFRAYLVRVDDLLLIQLEWLGVAPEDGDRYQVCRYRLEEGVLTAEMLNDKIVGAEIADSKALRETILANRANPDLFFDPGRYRRRD